MRYKQMQQRTPCAEMMPAKQCYLLYKNYLNHNTDREERKVEEKEYEEEYQ